MTHSTKPLALFYWLLTLASFAAVTAMLFTYTPPIVINGEIKRIFNIFYVHLPVAINTFLAAAVVFIASIGYLWRRDLWWDDLAAGAGRITALLACLVLATGMIWAHSAWGTWWSWTPRLTLSLVLWLLYVVYVMLRSSIESPDRRALVGAVYGIVAFLDVPLVYLSTRLLPDILHPISVGLEPRMKLTLAAWFVPVTMLTAGLIVRSFRRVSASRLARARDVEN